MKGMDVDSSCNEDHVDVGPSDRPLSCSAAYKSRGLTDVRRLFYAIFGLLGALKTLSSIWPKVILGYSSFFLRLREFFKTYTFLKDYI